MTDPSERLETRIHELKAGLVAVARGDNAALPQKQYKDTRRLILASLTLRSLAPPWLIAASTVVEANSLIQEKADVRPGGKWANRAAVISEDLNPLLAQIDKERAEFEMTGTLGALLGAGGFGEVYRWRHHTLEMDFAIKVLNPSFPEAEGQYLERFFREAKILLKLNHPNIVRVYDVGMYRQRPYIKMELLEGHTLNDVLQLFGLIAPPRAAEIVTQMLRGIGHAHRQNVVHRDIKPSNVFSTSDRITLIDFGLGAFVEGELISRLTRTGEAAAGGLFTAPELVANPKRLDPRTDVYSVGAVLYNVLTGRPPAGTLLEEQLSRIDGLSKDYRDVVMRALADEASRFQSAAEFEYAIAPFLPRTVSARGFSGEHRDLYTSEMPADQHVLLLDGRVRMAWVQRSSALDIEILNVSRQPVLENIVIQLLGLHLWSDERQSFIDAPELQGRSVLALTLHSERIDQSRVPLGMSDTYSAFQGIPLTFLFLTHDGAQMQITGQRGSSLGTLSLRTTGTWRASLRVTVRGPGLGYSTQSNPAERAEVQFMYFKWDGSSPPEPADG